jgi:hypothetical protein
MAWPYCFAVLKRFAATVWRAFRDDQRADFPQCAMICATEASLSTTICLQTVSKSGIKTRSASIALRLAALTIICVLASAGFNDTVAAKTKSKNVHIQYVEPSNPYRSIYDQSKELRVLEYVQELLLPSAFLVRSLSS